MKPTIEITITPADLESARQCPWSGKTCLIAQAFRRTFDEHVIASSWNCVDALSRDFGELHGYSFNDATVTQLMSLFDRGHLRDAEAITSLLPYTFAVERTCNRRLESHVQERYRYVFTPKDSRPRSLLHLLDIAIITDFLAASKAKQ